MSLIGLLLLAVVDYNDYLATMLDGYVSVRNY